ncbi:hypothetical protein [Salinarchaeum laminariae]|uniref:hypothetical protein n=1 Tax=Salinarchaeum laminariae TaxID=869888 RepID=UPI0020C15EAE|nr:hypothetical protein [Salinarchaeum laminariae]
MIDTIPSEAKEQNLKRTDYNLLLVALGWYNGRSFTIADEKHQIGSHYEPALEDLCLSKGLEYDPEAHERLLGAKWFTEETICRRKVDWVPTQEGLEKMEIACEEHAEHVRPRWRGGRSRHSPVAGDDGESLLHRKGVEIARQQLDFYWLFPLPPDKMNKHGLNMYPRNQDEERTLDIEITTSDNFGPWGAEVVTRDEDYFDVMKKWRNVTQMDRRVVWLFEDRVHACKILNRVHEQNMFKFRNGKIRKPQNWAVRNLNRRVWKAQKNFADRNGNIVHTVTGMLEASQDEIKTYFEDFYDHAQ